MSIKAQRFLNGMIDIVIPLLATAIALILGAFMLIAFRKNPLEAYAALVSGAFGSSRALIQTTLKATPLLLVGTGICFPGVGQKEAGCRGRRGGFSDSRL